ncbi:hypothetical protein GQ457_15G002650 [Hibiscus cannabinus]
MASSLLVHDTLQLISRPWNVKIRHIPRYKNGVADRLANISRDLPSASMFFDNPPLEVADYLYHDSSGLEGSYAPYMFLCLSYFIVLLSVLFFSFRIMRFLTRL